MNTGQQIIFDYTDGPSAPISADWARELGLMDCETHEVDADRYPIGCAEESSSSAQAAHPLLSTSPADQSSASPLLNTDGPSGMGSPLALLGVVALVGLGVLGYQLFTSRPRKGAPDAADTAS